jgi:peptidoglycan/xylan/chitin deacetylase (PgdA/CDA1 family)
MRWFRPRNPLKTNRPEGLTVPPPKPVILLYHRIGNVASDARHLALTPERFDRDMRFLRDHRNPMPLSEMLKAAVRGCLPDNAVAVTFDDGYYDALTTVTPILQRYAIPASFFVNSSDLESGSEFWGDILERIFFETETLPTSLVWSFGNGESAWPVQTAAHREALWERLNQSFYTLGAEHQREYIARLLRWARLDARPRDSHRRMTTAEIRQLLRCSDFSLGAHTKNHLLLTSHDERTQRRELVDDKLMLQHLFGAHVDTVAYPYGAYDDRVVSNAACAGFMYGLTVDFGSLDSAVDRMRIPRLEPGRAEYLSVAEALWALARATH